MNKSRNCVKKSSVALACCLAFISPFVYAQTIYFPMTPEEKNSLRNGLAGCWSVPSSFRYIHGITVIITVDMNPDGSVMNAALKEADRKRYDTDSNFRTVADSALKAVQTCSPLKGLPPEKYDSWRQMEIAFNPEEIVDAPLPDTEEKIIKNGLGRDVRLPPPPASEASKVSIYIPQLQ